MNKWISFHSTAGVYPMIYDTVSDVIGNEKWAFRGFLVYKHHFNSVFLQSSHFMKVLVINEYLSFLVEWGENW